MTGITRGDRIRNIDLRNELEVKSLLEYVEKKTIELVGTPTKDGRGKNKKKRMGCQSSNKA